MTEQSFTLGERVRYQEGESERHGTITETDCDKPSDKEDGPGQWYCVEFDEGGSEVVNAVDLAPSETRPNDD